MLYWNTEYVGILHISLFEVIFISTEKTCIFFSSAASSEET